ncbi:hypothetical protein L3X38_005995 [Prunus dulcis]|uniref:Uncharacterized protein n=1 Tax=Prunus dulcis TaxID=3755 RepID=A0AAD5F4R4_PRUDU|nr:hypothetical protein L3X38_005995 [Prunus dulcis]
MGFTSLGKLTEKTRLGCCSKATDISNCLSILFLLLTRVSTADVSVTSSLTHQLTETNDYKPYGFFWTQRRTHSGVNGVKRPHGLHGSKIEGGFEIGYDPMREGICRQEEEEDEQGSVLFERSWPKRRRFGPDARIFF